MSLRFKKNIIITVFSGLILLVGLSAQAAFLKSTRDIEGNAGVAGGLGGYEVNNSDIYSLVQTVINAFLSLIGVILLAYLLYAGYKWMTAHGDEEKVTAAKETINRAIIGVIIIVAAYAISIFVVGRLQAPLSGGANPNQQQNSPINIPNNNAGDQPPAA